MLKATKLYKAQVKGEGEKTVSIITFKNITDGNKTMKYSSLKKKMKYLMEFLIYL